MVEALRDLLVHSARSQRSFPSSDVALRITDSHHLAQRFHQRSLHSVS